MTTLTFPEGFQWGAATAAAQIEGRSLAFTQATAPVLWD